MTTTWNAIYLGVQPLIDPTEGNMGAENAGLLAQRMYGSAADPLHDQQVSVATMDAGGTAGVLDQDNALSDDSLTYDLGHGPQTQTFDATSSYYGRLTYADGTTYDGVFVIAQDAAGHTFLVPEISAGPDQQALEAKPITSVWLDRLHTSDAQGLNQSRQSGQFMTCFAAGTRIATPRGEVPVEDLAPGDLVLTADGGARPLIWVGRAEVAGRGAFAPIRIARGVLGNRRPLRVSAQHRMLLAGWRAELMFGEAEVLAAACHLVDDVRILPVPCDRITYHHLLFDRHEIIFAEGSPTESFFPGAATMAQGDAALRAEMLALFPDLAGQGGAFAQTARRVLRGAEARAWQADGRDAGPYRAAA